ncbi:ras-related protein Rab-10-like isoform X2 [Pseudonaja textilis]|uniref:ras-related protein Rab-10-like isoform X2 n=1 Tax=Pseudonaja textilis TaxID=8673 RepID=UPI000EAA9EBD|nr:ras-related protein Rab-10-like isoform X2 [Pseudonaja textilis]
MAEGTGCEAPKTCLAKIVMVGDSFVGKTSILRRYTDFCTTGRAPSSSYITTVGIDFKEKTISCDNTTMKLQIWDTAGQERFHTFTTSFFRGAHGFVLVYDITDGKSFQGISHWMKDIYELAWEYGIPFFETSAKDNINIENAFSVLAKEILNKNSHVLLNLDVVDLNEKLQTRSCCKL